jgi:hypothetical protein
MIRGPDDQRMRWPGDEKPRSRNDEGTKGLGMKRPGDKNSGDEV